jgi:hypothetical protein
MEDLQTNVKLNMRLIRRSLDSGSEEGKRAVAQNFQAAAAAVRSAMHAGTVSTREGTAQISRYLRQALAVYGITGQQATNYIHSPIGDLQGKPVGAASPRTLAGPISRSVSAMRAAAGSARRACAARTPSRSCWVLVRRS